MRADWIGVCAAVALAAMAACGDSSSTRPKVGGETHWLMACDDDSWCDVGQCLCGVCTAPCSGDDACRTPGEEGCFEVASPGLADRCASSPAIAEPGICLAFCQSDSDCRLGTRCLNGACVADETYTQEPIAPLPEPDTVIIGAPPELVGTWAAVHEDGTPCTLAEPSENVFNDATCLHLRIEEGPAGVTGSVFWLGPGAPTATFESRFEPATDPDAGYPVGVPPVEYWEGYRQTRWGIPYRVLEGAYEAEELTFWISGMDVWRDWCALQESFPVQTDQGVLYQCVPASATLDDTDLGKLALCTSGSAAEACPTAPGPSFEELPEECRCLYEDPLCSPAYCTCSQAGCIADFDSGYQPMKITFDLSTLTATYSSFYSRPDQPPARLAKVTP